MTVQQLPRFVASSALVLAPLLFLASALAAPSLANGAAAQTAEIARHSDRYYLFTLLTLIGTALFVPVLLELMRLARSRAPFPAIVGAGLMQVGTLVGVADAGTQLVYWQTGARGADPAQMTALLDRVENAASVSIVFMVGGFSLIAGSLLLGIALWRTRVAPAWAALCLPLGVISNIFAFAAGSRPLLAGSSLVLLAGLTAVAARRAPAATPATTAAATGAP